MAFVLSAIFFNTSAIGKLPILEGLAVVLHFFGFFAFIIILWVSETPIKKNMVKVAEGSVPEITLQELRSASIQSERY